MTARWRLNGFKTRYANAECPLRINVLRKENRFEPVLIPESLAVLFRRPTGEKISFLRRRSKGKERRSSIELSLLSQTHHTKAGEEARFSLTHSLGVSQWKFPLYMA